MTGAIEEPESKGGTLSHLRYQGFDQTNNIREYRFDDIVAGQARKHFVVTADVSLFVKHRVGMQEGPTLCFQKLSALSDTLLELRYELTSDDLVAFLSVRAAALEKKASSRSWRERQKLAPPPSQ